MTSTSLTLVAPAGRWLIAVIAIGSLFGCGGTLQKLEYRETGYTSDYTWNDLEVGTVIRFPINNPIPTGRYYAVIAFKTGQMADARILLQGASGEVPERPKFVSGEEQTVVYRTKSKGDVTLDLSQWTTYPVRDAAK